MWWPSSIVFFSVSDSSSARPRQPLCASSSEFTYRPCQLKPNPLPSIICMVAPSAPIGSQIASPSACSGIDTRSTVAPRPRNRSPASRTIASLASDELAWPKPSSTTAMRRPRTSRLRASRYGLDWPPYWRGSSPSGPASTSSSSALSSTVPVIGPVWSSVSSIGMMPV